MSLQLPPLQSQSALIEPTGSSEIVSNAFVPTAGQQAALEAGGSAPGLVIAGYAGTGKTTMLRLIAAEYGQPLVLTPTGKAALRVSQASGLPAQTIHRWMYSPVTNPRTGKVQFVEKNSALQIPRSGLVVVDEASMLGSKLWADLQRICKNHALRVVLVGDAFQLPPVEPGAPPFSTMTADFAAKIGFARVELTEILRQCAGSPVIQASMRLRAGEGFKALEHLPHVQTAQLGDCAVATYQAGGVIITHTNAARFRVNYGMRLALVGTDAGTRGPAQGEPLLCLHNTYELDMWNGEQVAFGGWDIEPRQEGALVSDRYADEEREIHFGVAFVGGQRAILALEELTGDQGKLGRAAIAYGAKRWALDAEARGSDGEPIPYLSANYGYCYTAHKAQGSEWPYALYICEPSVKLNAVEGRRHAYTAITRASKQAAVFFGRV